MMRKLLIAIAVIVISIIAILVIVVQQPRFWEQGALKVLNGRWPVFVLKEINIDQVHVSRSGEFTFRNITAKLKVHGDSYFISAGSLDLKGAWQILTASADLPLIVNHIAVVSDKINASDAQLQGHVIFKSGHFDHFAGHATANLIEFQEYRLSAFASTVNLDGHHLILNESATMYGGQLSGDFNMQYAPSLDYTGSMHIENIDFGQLAQVKESIFTGTTGEFSGDVYMKTRPPSLDALKVDFHSSPRGGKITAKLLALLAEILPQNTFLRAPLDSIIKKQSIIPFEKFSASIEYVSKDTYKGTINIYSSPAAIDLRYNYDINMGGDLESLGETFMAYLKLLQR